MGKDLFSPFARKSMVGRAAVVLILGKPKGSKPWFFFYHFTMKLIGLSCGFSPTNQSNENGENLWHTLW